MKKYKKLSVIVILSCAQFIGCSAVVKPDNPRPNIILIINDSLRASNLGCYGYQKDNISPNIDKLADEGIVFTNVISQAGYTLPSIASILTSKYLLTMEHTHNTKNCAMKRIHWQRYLKKVVMRQQLLLDVGIRVRYMAWIKVSIYTKRQMGEA